MPTQKHRITGAGHARETAEPRSVADAGADHLCVVVPDVLLVLETTRSHALRGSVLEAVVF
ncbi:MAG: hypothetical protein LRY66_10365 [Saccharospirillaceae bacterium]|nr:hypothetical protein [Saccharospirillaceae bacterium]MCD8531739.1 hypothetical protein [Saccharospirillaceae bacterium]